MKEPGSKLPWYLQGDEMYDANENIPLEKCVDADMKYIVEAANNYPEAVALLKKAHNILLAKDEVSIAYYIEEFLRRIEED